MNKFVINKKGVFDLMKSKEMQNVLEEKAKTIKNRCGSGFEQDVYIGRNRANAGIYAVTKKAIDKCYKENILLKELR